MPRSENSFIKDLIDNLLWFLKIFYILVFHPFLKFLKMVKSIWEGDFIFPQPGKKERPKILIDDITWKDSIGYMTDENL